ncbi:MAG: hypothetical protein AAF250_12320 [Pseudomonadota bacterium]
MPKSPAQQSIRIGSETDPDLPNMAAPSWAAWQAHLDAGRIGGHLRSTAPHHEAGGSTQTPEQRRIHARNEMILCGYRVHPTYEDSGPDVGSRYCRGFVG